MILKGNKIISFDNVETFDKDVINHIHYVDKMGAHVDDTTVTVWDERITVVYKILMHKRRKLVCEFKSCQFK